MGEISVFALKVLIVMNAIPATLLLVYWTSLLIANMDAKLAVKYCPECQKRKKEEKRKKKLVVEDKDIDI